jgi:hypothetical protein
VLVQNVPALGVQKELVALFSSHGSIQEYARREHTTHTHFLALSRSRTAAACRCRAIGEEELPREQFTEVYLLSFAQLADARCVPAPGPCLSSARVRR